MEWRLFRRSQDLQPDLILLDVGLPHLNGIEVGRQVSKLAPLARILFLSQEFSLRCGSGGFPHWRAGICSQAACRR